MFCCALLAASRREHISLHCTDCNLQSRVGITIRTPHGKGVKQIANTEVRSPAEHHAAMTSAQRLKRVFSIEIEVCGRCGGSVRVIADASDRCIEEQVPHGDRGPDRAGIRTDLRENVALTIEPARVLLAACARADARARHRFCAGAGLPGT